MTTHTTTSTTTRTAASDPHREPVAEKRVTPHRDIRFFDDTSMDYMTRGLLGRAVSGGSDIGEILTTAERIPDGDSAAWVRQWEVTGDRIAAIADDCAAHGHLISARAAYLRAATYYATSVAVVDADPDRDATLARVFAAHQRCFAQHVALLENPPERVAIPYEDTTMPGWFFPAHLAPGQPDGPRPTIVLNNGADGAVTALWPGIGAQAVERGYNALIFIGPGQQDLLFQRGIPFRPDWEAVLTPVVDFLLARPDVDGDRLGVYGVSQGGYWVPRSLAFEHRFAAAVVDGGVVDVSAAWYAQLPPQALALLDAGDRDGFNALVDLATPAIRRTLDWRATPYGTETQYDAFVAVRDYRITPELAARISTPILVADPDGEQFFTGQPEQLFALLPEPKRLVRFTAEEGGSAHCEPMAKALVAQRFFDFFDEVLDPTGARCGG